MTESAAAPWWKFGHVWLVISGPAAVVVACVITAYFVITRPDPVLDEDYYQKGVEINKTLGEGGSSTAPAQLARNHAATGVPEPKSAAASK